MKRSIWDVGEIIGMSKRAFCFLLGAIGLILFMLLFVKIEIWDDIPSYATHAGNYDEEQFIYNWPEKVTIEQKFRCERDFDFITLSMSNHDQNIEGKTIIQVDEVETGETVYYGEADNTQIRYGEYIKIPFVNGGEGKKDYVVSLYQTELGDVQPGIFGYQVEKEEGAVINGEKSKYAISLGIHSYTSLYKGMVIFAFSFVTVMLLLCLEGIRRKWSEEKMFLCMAIPLGVAYLSILSINPVHDGSTHLAKVYQYSNRMLGWDKYEHIGHVYLRGDEKECFDGMSSEVYRENEQAQMFWETYQDFGIKTSDKTLLESRGYRETGASSFWEYFPGIMGMSFGRIIGGSARLNIFLAKLFFYAFYIGVCWLAIRVSPRLKASLSFVALLPMAIYQATGITYDSTVVASAMILFGLWMKARETGLGKRGWLCAIFFAYILGCCKGGIYSLILGLFILVPEGNLGGKKRKYIFCVLVWMVALLGIGMTSINAYLPYVKNILGVSDTAENVIMESVGTEVIETVPGKDVTAYGIMYIFNNPVQCAKLLFHSFLEKMDYIGGVIGYRMAWSDELTPWFVIGIFAVSLLISAIHDRVSGKETNIRLKDRVACVIFVGIELVAFHLIMLIETPAGSAVISGVQGRYFIALLPAFLFVLIDRNKYKPEYMSHKLFMGYGIGHLLYFGYYMKIFLGIK